MIKLDATVSEDVTVTISVHDSFMNNTFYLNTTMYYLDKASIPNQVQCAINVEL